MVLNVNGYTEQLQSFVDFATERTQAGKGKAIAQAGIENTPMLRFIMGLVMVVIVGGVILGGIKRIALFATSGGSDIGKTVGKLRPYVKGDCRIIAAKVFKSGEDVTEWVKGIVKE